MTSNSIVVKLTFDLNFVRLTLGSRLKHRLMPFLSRGWEISKTVRSRSASSPTFVKIQHPSVQHRRTDSPARPFDPGKRIMVINISTSIRRHCPISLTNEFKSKVKNILNCSRSSKSNVSSGKMPYVDVTPIADVRSHRSIYFTS